MYNDISIGPVTIHMYGIMIAIGFASAYLISDYRAKKKGLDSDIIFGILWCAVVGGMAGSRLLYYIVSIRDIVKSPGLIWDFSHGYVVYGGIIGGVTAGYIYINIKKEKFLRYFDLVIPEVALAQGFGRIGCFFAGCCYGRETKLPIAVVFKNSSYAPNGVGLIPTQLISGAGDFIIAAVLFLYSKKSAKDGNVASLYMILYSIGRFFIEFLRGDYRGSVGVLSTSQIISVIIFAAGAVMRICIAKKSSHKVKS